MKNDACFERLADHAPRPLQQRLAWEAVVLVSPRQDLGPGPAGHRFFMENPSLSGRGSAGASDVPVLTHDQD